MRLGAAGASHPTSPPHRALVTQLETWLLGGRRVINAANAANRDCQAWSIPRAPMLALGPKRHRRPLTFGHGTIPRCPALLYIAALRGTNSRSHGLPWCSAGQTTCPREPPAWLRSQYHNSQLLFRRDLAGPEAILVCWSFLESSASRGLLWCPLLTRTSTHDLLNAPSAYLLILSGIGVSR